MNVLVVDDDAITRRMVSHVLCKHGATVTAVESSANALSAIRDQDFEVIVTDWNMPGLSGVELCRRIRSLGEELRVVMLTAQASHEDRVAAEQAGVDAFVAKPFQASDLAECVLQRSAARIHAR